jgi:uncharacterized protein
MRSTKNSNLTINVAQLLKGPTGAVRRVDLSEDITGIDDELTIRSPLTGSLTLVRTAEGILVTASLEIELEVECSRCLDPFIVRVRPEIEEEFHPSVDIRTGVQLPVVDTEEDATTIDEHHNLDLTEVARQAIFLSLPMNGLCKQDCAGLCSLCGHNLNEEQCQCETDTVDPRLEVLKQLL